LNTNCRAVFNPGRTHFTTPYDASAVVPSWVWIVVLLFFGYVGIRVYFEIERDKNTQENNFHPKTQLKKRSIRSIKTFHWKKGSNR
jgi:hypothetical protein